MKEQKFSRETEAWRMVWVHEGKWSQTELPEQLLQVRASNCHCSHPKSTHAPPGEGRSKELRFDVKPAAGSQVAAVFMRAPSR